ncbi:MAG TPA: DUF5668 domain-containing protein [Acidobacteriota bacterium]|nr:DUF5668 domain-containing protein [Acidobacteriota bacterium]HRR25699.1 DUF5668 domain-containing protein [Acidobacteriota bacterium]HRR56247.1 DUF5668 domain-containing protein [Acidobacteriota bacterium]
MNNEQSGGTTPPAAPPSPPPTPPRPEQARAVRAALLALIPGMGAVYNCEYTKAVAHFAVFASFIVLADYHGIFGLAAFCFYVFMIIDAYRSAEVGPPEERRGGREEMNFPVWGCALVFLGVLFLLDNLGAIHLRSAAQFWPLLLIALGIYLILQHFHQPGAAPSGPRELQVQDQSSRDQSSGSPEEGS